MKFFVALALCLVLASAAYSQNWPSFRGKNGAKSDGRSPNVHPRNRRKMIIIRGQKHVFGIAQKTVLRMRVTRANHRQSGCPQLQFVSVPPAAFLQCKLQYLSSAPREHLHGV